MFEKSRLAFIIKYVFYMVRIIVLAIIFVMCGCSDLLFLSEDSAYMPIKLTGNSQSDVLIVIVHGGPGSGSLMYYSADDNFRYIEEHYRVAYYEQRLAGISQGNVSKKSLTLKNYAEDLHKIILLLRNTEMPEKIVIAAHSFGGMVALRYLESFGKADLINGLIYMNGLHNTPLAYSSSIKKVREFAQKQIDNNVDSKYWKEALEYYLKIDTTRLLSKSKHYEYVINSKGVHYETPIKYVTFGKIFFSEAAGLDNLFNSKVSLNSIGDDILKADLSEVLPFISLPTLILWGRHDGVVPISSAYDIADKIGTADSLKKLVILEKSAHEPFVEQSFEFAEAVNLFIKQCVK